jgi:hypothetical protein
MATSTLWPQADEQLWARCVLALKAGGQPRLTVRAGFEPRPRTFAGPARERNDAGAAKR